MRHSPAPDHPPANAIRFAHSPTDEWSEPPDQAKNNRKTKREKSENEARPWYDDKIIVESIAPRCPREEIFSPKSRYRQRPPRGTPTSRRPVLNAPEGPIGVIVSGLEGCGLRPFKSSRRGRRRSQRGARATSGGDGPRGADWGNRVGDLKGVACGHLRAADEDVGVPRGARAPHPVGPEDGCGGNPACDGVSKA